MQKIRKDGLNVSQYIAQIKDIDGKFSAIGKPLSYRDNPGYVLKGLGIEYNAFVTSIQNQTNRPSIADVWNILIAYDARLEKQNSMDQLNLVQVNFANLSTNLR